MDRGSAIKRKLVRCAREVFRKGYVIGSGGNISARIGGVIFLKAKGAKLKSSTIDDYVPVRIKDGKVASKGASPSFEMPLHLACYRARPDINAVIHTHPLFATVYAMSGKELRHISYETMAVMRSTVPVIRRITPGSRVLAREVAVALKDHNAALLKNHGAVVVGKDLDEALLRTEALERMCAICVLSKLTGKPRFIPDIELARCAG
ncbi:class II aldolase/adducin family protein [Candidatus Omnitrophota bacterium]